MVILIHTSKTMRPPAKHASGIAKPQLLRKTELLSSYLKTLDTTQIQKAMQLSPKLAITTKDLTKIWTADPSQQRPAIDSFIGDIYSGLQVQNWDDRDRRYADEHLRILSGLYGILRALDGIFPYRLEMGYKLPSEEYRSLYSFWGQDIARTLPSSGPIVNLAAVEYSKTITDFVDQDRVISPKFLTINPQTKEPTFVVVHAKIARGAYANWLIKNRVSDKNQLKDFKDLYYSYNQQLSSPNEPVFICPEFGGIGLSVRLT